MRDVLRHVHMHPAVHHLLLLLSSIMLVEIHLCYICRTAFLGYY